MSFFTQNQCDMLLAAYRKLDKSSPVFPSPEDATLNTVMLLSMPFMQSYHKVRYGDPRERDRLLAQIIACRYYLIAEAISKRKDEWFKPFQSYFTQISNTIAAVMLLAEHGFDFQATSQLRNAVELFMMLTVAADSAEKRKLLETSLTGDAYTLWRQHFSKSRFVEMISSYSEKFSYLVDSVKEWADQKYGELSSFAHNDYANVLSYSVSASDENGDTHQNFWGKYVTRVRK